MKDKLLKLLRNYCLIDIRNWNILCSDICYSAGISGIYEKN